MDYDFKHLELRMAALSEEMTTLWMAGKELQFDVDPVEEMFRLDCVPNEVTIAAQAVVDGGTAIGEVARWFEETRRNLLRKWKGEAADAFAAESTQLHGSMIAQHSRVKKNGAAGLQISEQLDELAKGGAADCKAVAVDVHEAAKIVVAGGGDGVEGAAEAVTTAIVTVQEIVRRKCAQIPEIGAALDNTRG